MDATKQPPMGDVERSVGFKGRFLVYYRRNGKRYWDAMYGPTEEQVRADFAAACDEIGWHGVEIERVEVRT